MSRMPRAAAPSLRGSRHQLVAASASAVDTPRRPQGHENELRFPYPSSQMLDAAAASVTVRHRRTAAQRPSATVEAPLSHLLRTRPAVSRSSPTDAATGRMPASSLNSGFQRPNRSSTSATAVSEYAIHTSVSTERDASKTGGSANADASANGRQGAPERW